MKKKAEEMIKSLNMRIDDAEREVKEEADKIMNELKNFDDWSATSIEYYARKMKEANEKKRSLIEQKRAIQNLVKE